MAGDESCTPGVELLEWKAVSYLEPLLAPS